LISNVQFINSNIKKIVESLISYQQHCQKAKSENLIDDDEKYNQLTQHLEKQLKSIDSKALEKEDNWWAEAIEQMYDGLI
jgi:Na+/phosphate symporter